MHLASAQALTSSKETKVILSSVAGTNMIRDKSRQHTLGTRLPDSILGSLQGVSSGSINVSIPMMAVKASDYSNAGAAS